ncbi:glycosyltransferase family 2 protein [Marinomonas sp. BSi20584]|uniref:glycosyltransferase family 2 protein n=1 Tax=Marinomonas sp. BSi20584 TaxID=1594462 RepID=UPI000C1EEE1D|nr:glycosyltransferase family 2 protein [Marinomonas sp. BSi20584]
MIKVSVIIPAYNCEGFIAQCINSVLEQDIENYEILVCDDSSTDNTYKELLKFTDSRIRLYKNTTNLGKIKTVERLLHLAIGKYCTILDSDDYISTEKLRKQSIFLDKKEDYAFIASSFYRVSETGIILSQEIIDRDFLGLNNSFINGDPMTVCCGTVMFRTKDGKELGGYNQYFTDCNGEDLDFISRLLSFGLGYSSSDTLYFYRYRANSLTRRVFDTPRQRHSHEIISFLYKQRLLNGGKDSLNSNLDGLSEFIETLSSRYVDDTGLMKRKCSIDFSLNKQYFKALRNCISGFRFRYFISSLKTFIFVVSIIMIPKFILLYLKGLFDYKNISKKL